MLKFVALAAVGAISAAGAAQTVVMLSRSDKGPEVQGPQLRNTQASVATQIAPVAAAQTVSAPAAGGSDASLVKSADGHFWAEAQVNGQRVRFLVDTGATTVALTLQDAERLGLRPQDLTYGYKVATANGEARAAAIKLASVQVAGARVDDVQALVIENGLPASLLGMSYLGRLSRFEATRTALILRP
jgi:aspartyl protease family protein